MISYSTIVFDMGRVLLNYDGTRAIRQFTEDPGIIREAANLIYCSGEWIMLDAGLISEEEALPKMLRRASSEQVREVAEKSFPVWEKYNMFTIEGIEDVLTELKAAGKKLYVLSNASMRVVNNWRKLLPLPDIYDGVFFSAPHKVLKPQRQIYEIFLDKFKLDPKDCFFLDDLKRNIDAAKECGIAGAQIPDCSVNRMREVLGLSVK